MPSYHPHYYCFHQARSQVLRFRVEKYIFRGARFLFLLYKKIGDTAPDFPLLGNGLVSTSLYTQVSLQKAREW